MERKASINRSDYKKRIKQAQSYKYLKTGNPVDNIRKQRGPKMPHKKDVFAGTGVSSNDNYQVALDEAITESVANITKSGCTRPIDYAFVFCSGKKYGPTHGDAKKFAKHAQDKLKDLNPKIKWIGCTTAGELSNKGASEGSVVVMTLSSEYISLGIGVSEKALKHPEKAGIECAERSLKDLTIDKNVHSYLNFLASKNKKIDTLVKRESYYVLSLFPGNSHDAFVRSDDILKGIKEATGYRIPIIGGNSADDFQLTGSFQFYNGKAYKNSVICATLVSDVLITYSAAHGYLPMSNPMIITKSEGSLIHEINNRPALDVYAETVKIPKEKLEKNLFGIGMQFPFGTPNNEGEYLIKAPGFVQGTSLLCAANVATNNVICVMKSDEKKLLNAVDTAIKNAKAAIHGDISAALIFSCAMRKAQLQKNITKSAKKIQKQLKNTPFVGLYTYGEQIAKGAVSNQQNINFSALLISDILVTD